MWVRGGLLGVLRVLVCFAMVLCGRAALAHSMYQGAVLLDYDAHSVDAELQLPQSRVERVLGQEILPGTLPRLEEPLAGYVLRRFHAESNGGAWTIRLLSPVWLESIDGAPYVVVRVRMLPPADGQVRAMRLGSDVLVDSVAGQVMLVSVRSDWASSVFANEPDLLGILTGDERSIEIDRGEGSWARGFASVFHLGTRHIAEGTDHLLFLFTLLLTAPLLWRDGRWSGFGGVRYGVMQILKVVTAFTVGHSLTLALAASGVVRVPGRPIEVLIAVSILISAMHALRPLFPGREAFIAGGFGLIHGLAFASTLAELGLRRWERVASIFAFNLGIEAMQLVVVVCVMPSLMLLSRTRVYGPFRVVGAALAGLAATGWALDRSFGWSIPVDPAVDGLARHAVLLAGMLFVAALGTYGVAERGVLAGGSRMGLGVGVRRGLRRRQD